MSDALQRLVQKTRPFKNFTVDFDGHEEKFKVRRTNVLENEAISKCYSDTYDAALKRMDNEDTSDYSLLRRQLARESAEGIASYLVMAAKDDIEEDALALFDGEEVSVEDEKVQAEIKDMSAKMQEELEKLPLEELTEMALNKREHFLALFEANKARMRMIATLAIYDEDGNKFFPTPESVGELDESTLEKIIKAASEALEDKKDEASPLK